MPDPITWQGVAIGVGSSLMTTLGVGYGIWSKFRSDAQARELEEKKNQLQVKLDEERLKLEQQKIDSSYTTEFRQDIMQRLKDLEGERRLDQSEINRLIKELIASNNLVQQERKEKHDIRDQWQADLSGFHLKEVTYLEQLGDLKESLERTMGEMKAAAIKEAAKCEKELAEVRARLEEMRNAPHELVPGTPAAPGGIEVAPATVTVTATPAVVIPSAGC